jgi:signal transduction histidine kinase
MLPLSLTTRFADPERLTDDQVLAQNRRVTAEPLVQGLLDSFPEPAMVLNEQRQIIFANDKLAAMLKRGRTGLIGLRPGEALACARIGEEEGGCGTSHFCTTCGAVRAILNSQESGAPDSQECRMMQQTPSGPAALDLRICTTPIRIEGETFMIFAVRDITDEKRRRVLERLFFHDLLNAAGGLRGILEIWPELSGEEALEISRTARGLSEQLVEEILSQRDLAAAERGDLVVEMKEFDAARLLVRLCILYSHHSIAEGRRIAPPAIAGGTMIRSDEVVLGRVLGNLIKNALEASQRGQTVSVSYVNDGTPIFTIHNDTAMSEEARLQMFQRSFSTKEGVGRGIGSYSVKLLTERYLKGSVTFRSHPGEGTTFTVRLP